jgi:Arc/MetJ-type ribon-helix-helix transcriptional regulator
MRYLVDVTQKQSDNINKLINAGKYQTMAQFILAAIENQIYIEESDAAQQPLFHKLPKTDNLITIKEKEHDKIGHPIVDVDIEPCLIVNIQNNPKILPMPKFEELAGSIKRGKALGEEHAWLWGQVNRIFPIKLGLRVLLVMLGDNETIELETFRNKAGSVALAYGRMIRSKERYDNKLRDEKVSAGLPININDSKFREAVIVELRKSKRLEDLDSYLQQEEFKSTNRYKAQFLTLVRKDGKLEGAMSFLRFVNVKQSDGKTCIGLTKAGLELAKLKNSIIDEKNFEKSLSDEERNFYLDHVSKNVKGESGAIRWLLKKIENGAAERDKITQEIKREFNQFWEDSDDVINTQRSGLMARMFELGLIEKKKNGVAVAYSISESGKKCLGKNQ